MTDLVDKSRKLYTPLDAEYVGSPKWTWTFPSGATVRFAYMKTDDDVWKYLGPRYSFIGFDESTLHTEKQVRNILGRLSSTDPELRLRARLTSNPGNVGAAWHQKLFLRGQCPVHPPESGENRLVPGKLYYDCLWPSDGAPIPFSVAFIPGRLSDHKLLDKDYSKRLHMMAGAAADAMEHGCWCALEGAYFTCLHKGMILPLAEAGVQWWHNHFISIDYGYGKSAAAAGLYVQSPWIDLEPGVQMSAPGWRPPVPASPASRAMPPVPRPDTTVKLPEGRIRKIGELVAPHKPAYEFAQMVVDAFVDPGPGGQRRRIVAAFLDPANFKDIGDGHTIADQINEVLAPWEIECQPASNDRIGGWQHLWRLLKGSGFEICDTCPSTFDALRTRMHDPAKPGDVKKLPGDSLDDVADETRYACYTFVQVAAVPREIQLQQAVQGLDLQSATVRWKQKEEELDLQERVPAMAGRHALHQAAMKMGRRRR